MKSSARPATVGSASPRTKKRYGSVSSGAAVGAALGLKGTGKLPVSILGDGDFLMASSALWTAAHYQLPLLMVIYDNRSFFNDEEHQRTVADMRSRPRENAWVGQRIEDPMVDLPGLARCYGLPNSPDALDSPVSPRGYRLLARVPRLPAGIIDRLVDHFDHDLFVLLGVEAVGRDVLNEIGVRGRVELGEQARPIRADSLR